MSRSRRWWWRQVPLREEVGTDPRPEVSREAGRQVTRRIRMRFHPPPASAATAFVAALSYWRDLAKRPISAGNGQVQNRTFRDSAGGARAKGVAVLPNRRAGRGAIEKTGKLVAIDAGQLDALRHRFVVLAVQDVWCQPAETPDPDLLDSELAIDLQFAYAAGGPND